MSVWVIVLPWTVYHNINTSFYLKIVNHQQKHTQSKSEGALLIIDTLWIILYTFLNKKGEINRNAKNNFSHERIIFQTIHEATGNNLKKKLLQGTICLISKVWESGERIWKW